MKRDNKIVIPMPDLSPEAACALADWISIIAHEVDVHSGDLIRSHLEARDREEAEIEAEINRMRQDDEYQEEFAF